MQSSHTEFGQAGYSQQYGFQSLQSVSANPAHDMSKQIPAGQPGMYPNSGGIPSGPQHHHQPGMTGPAPSPQPSSIVNPSQQLNRSHVTIPNFYARNNVPRTVQNMGRSNMPAVVNQPQQPAASQYSHMQLVASHPMHPVTPTILVNHHGLAAPMYQQGRYQSPPSYGIINPATTQLYSYNWNNFNNTPHGGANGYYPPPQLSTYPLNNQQVHSAQPSAASAQPTKKRLQIIDPSTGKDILEEGIDEENQPTKDEMPRNDSICAQFATQVAQVATQVAGQTHKKDSLETSTVENPPVVQSSVIGPTTEVETINTVDQVGSVNVNDINEPFTDDIEESIPYYNKETDIDVIDSYENKSSIEDSLTIDTQNLILNNETILVSPPKEVESLTDNNQTEKSHYGVQELTEVSVKSVSPDRTIEDQPTSIVEETAPVADSDLVNSNTRNEKNEAKKKTKKKKDFNKRVESKEGGEMDAFLDKTEETSASQVTTQVPAMASSNDTVPPVTETKAPSPVPIMDSEVLSTIPLPGEVTPRTEDSDKELAPVESAVVSSIENDLEDKENITEESSQNKIVLKYTYKEDQWSPLNPEGKKQYDRDFLLQLQSQPMSLCKPSNLPNLDVIKDKAHIQRLTEVNRAAPMTMAPVRAFDPFLPNYSRGGNALRPPHPTVNRRSQQGQRDKKQKIIVLPLNQNVKLHEADNAWRPSHKCERTADEDAEEQDLFRRIRGILNKLTPQKFQTLVEQVKELPIDSMRKLEGTINLIFEKALDEPNFSVPYANMCKQLITINVPLDGGQGVVSFRKLLLTKCQKEFEQDKGAEKKREEILAAIKAAKDNEEKCKELQMELDEEDKKIRMRQLGNIRFIGELFKLNMLIEPIMHDCIKKLLTQGDEESLECLCRLLKTIGKELDEKGKNSRDNLMDGYFITMQKIVDKRLTSSRVRFMLQDVIDLKKNNWIPRRDENNPKTIDQIHKEAEKEARESQLNYQNIPYSKRVPDDRRKMSGRNMGVSEDGWTPTSKSNKGSYNLVDPSKLKLTKPDEVDSIRLGPGGKGPQSWGKGSSGGNRSSVDSDVKTALTNRYSALADQSLNPSFENRRGSQRSAASSRESSRGRNSQLPPVVRKTPSTSRERESLIETVKELNRNMVQEPKSQDTKKPDSQVNGKMAEVVAVLALNGPELSEDEIKKKTEPLIDEFLHNTDFEEAEKCVMELASPSTVHYFIYFAINQVLERSSQARNLLGQLLYSLVKKELVTLEQYKKGLSGLLENIEDYVVDIPFIWEYMGNILEPMVEDNKLPLTILKDILEPCIPSETAGILVSSVLHCAAKKKGTVKLGEMWKESGLQWSDFLENSININKFISNNKLEFTVSQTKVIPNAEISMEEIRTKLRELLETTEDNEPIFDYIDAKVPPSAVSEPAFIRALAQEVHKAAIIGTGSKCELDQPTLRKRIPLLTRYIDHDEKLELQALYAVQHLTTDLKQPKGVLRQIFDTLYDDDVITEETFKVWESSNDPAEIEGKGVALLCVRGFFTWLREAESGEDVEDE